MTRKVNEHNIRFPRDEKGNVDDKNGQYGTNNQPKKATFKYEQEGRFCLGVANIESNNGKITGKRCPVFDYTNKKIVTIGAYKRKILKEFARVRQLTSSSSQWILKKNIETVWLCESIGKLKGVGQLAIAKINELRIYRIADISFMFVIVARCLFEASAKFMQWLFKLSRVILRLLSRTTGKRKIRIIRDANLG